LTALARSLLSHEGLGQAGPLRHDPKEHGCYVMATSPGLTY